MTQHQNDFQDGFLTKKTLNKTVPKNNATKNICNESGRLNRSNIIDA
jgi:hypothetical protein